MSTDFQKFITENKAKGEWELSRVQQDFLNICEHVEHIEIDVITLIHQDIFNANGDIDFQTENIIFKTFKEIEECNDDWWSGLFAFNPNGSGDWIYLLIDDYATIADILFHFTQVINEAEINLFFNQQNKENTLLEEVYKHLMKINYNLKKEI